MARWAAMPSSWERPNEVAACTSVAPATANASGSSSSTCLRPITLSMRNFELAGSTMPASRDTSISTMPTASRPRRAQTMSRASRHTVDIDGSLRPAGAALAPGPDIEAAAPRSARRAMPAMPRTLIDDLEQRPQPRRPPRPPQLAQRLGLDLPHPLAGDVERAADLFEGE